MPELLLEIGTEELPATSVRRAYTELGALIAKLLLEAGLGSVTPTVFGTPRRLIVAIPDVPARQADQTKDQRGPSAKAAYGADGAPSGALLGFCKSQGIDVSNLRTEGEYVWVTKQIPGRDSTEVLSDLIPKAVRGLTFDKTMRWGDSRMRFARPIRWIVALFDGQVIPFDIEGVVSDRFSRGHRFYKPETFAVHSLSELVEGLRSRKVEVDPLVREKSIVDQAVSVALGAPDLSASLVDENVFLTEWPTAIAGMFKSDFENLPESVLVTAMAKHEKMFPVRDSAGKLTNQFVFIRNAGEDETVRKGAEWVLNARFNDAKFFFDEDLKFTLDDFLEKTNGILFQEKLGTVRKRADRLASLSKYVAEKTGGDGASTEIAGRYAKADLSTGLVSELASLQGIIGGEYARREGLPESACAAIASQYDLEKATSDTSRCLIVADQLDKLAGYLGLGLAPTGSSDPYALRRACNQLIEIAWRWPSAMPDYDEFFAWALDLYSAQGIDLDRELATRSFHEALASRYDALLPDARYDLLDAALKSRSGSDVTKPRGLRFRLRILETLATDVAFVQTATRPLNILASAAKKNIAFPLDDAGANLESEQGVLLAEATRSISAELEQAANEEDDIKAAELLTRLSGPITIFFDSTMVMAEDVAVRDARLSLLNQVANHLLVAGDWSKVVIEG